MDFTIWGIASSDGRCGFVNTVRGMENIMTERILTTICKIEAAPGQRLLVVSDIHGHFNHLVQLLKRLEYGGDDILVIVGDLIDKGPESLRVVQYVMELSKRRPVYVSAGNVDIHRMKLILDDEPEAGEKFADFLEGVEKRWGCSIFKDMLSDLGIGLHQVTAETAPEYMKRLREHFREELDFLRNLPTILTAGKYLFVHGGVPTDDLSALEGTEAEKYLKNDRFLEQGFRFERYTVVTGHWPVCLYRQKYEDVSPLFDSERKILCIDGGCGIKQAGQLNGIIIPDCMADIGEISWACYDDFQVVTALDPQEEKPASLHVQYLDSRVKLLEERGEMGIVMHESSGKIFELPVNWVGKYSDGQLHSNDYCDRLLPVKPGDELSVVFEAAGRRYVKSRGQIGWYEGNVRPVETKR